MAVVNRRTVKVRLAIIAVLLIGYFGFRLASGNHEPVVPKRQPVERVALDASNRHDLSRDEARGGHTLQRHMGKTDADLQIGRASCRERGANLASAVFVLEIGIGIY